MILRKKVHAKKKKEVRKGNKTMWTTEENEAKLLLKSQYIILPVFLHIILLIFIEQLLCVRKGAESWVWECIRQTL